MIILKHDKSNYINHNIVRNLKNGSGLYLPQRNGGAFYLPSNSCEYCGKGIGDIISTIFRFANSNKDSIKNIIDTASNVVNLGSATSKGVTDTIKAVQDIQAKQISGQKLASAEMQISGQTGKSISPELMKEILVEERGPKVKIKKKRGSGFIYY